MRGWKALTVSLVILNAWVGAGCASARRDWEAARRVDEIQAYDWFLDHHPKAEQAPEARHRRELLRRDQPAWEQATREGTVDAYERFAAQHRDSPYAERARNIIAECRQDEARRDIVDALAQGKVQVEATGAGGSLVSLRIRRTVDRPVRVVVPVGTVFACRGSAQDMITLAEGAVELEDGDWTGLILLAACVDLMKPIPQPGDTFGIERSAKQKDLRKLMEALRADPLHVQIVSVDAATGQYQYFGPASDELQRAVDVVQAAVWIVTGDANYYQLGILRRNPSGGPAWPHSPRSIDETDAAMAMRLVDHAGIDIKKKAIWRDRQTIAPAVSDPALKNWIVRK